MTPSEYRAMKSAKRERRRLGREACAKGEHTKQLTWLHYSRRPVIVTNQPTGMLVATGIIGGSNVVTVDGKRLAKPLAEYMGYCSRCGEALEWASDRKAIPAASPQEKQNG